MTATASSVPGRASALPGRAQWEQDAAGVWWYVTPSRCAKRGDRLQRFRGGWRTCEECEGSYLAVNSSKQRFCSKSCTTRVRNRARRLSPGSTRTMKSGYVLEKVAHTDPFFGMGRGGDKNGSWILQHRLVVARSLGRPLADHEQVHHINGDRGDNSLANLQLRGTAHGAGQVMRCACCGSRDITFEEV